MSEPVVEKPAATSDDAIADPAPPRRSKWARFWRYLCNSFGFQRMGNFVGFIVLGGAMFGFSLSRMEFYNPKKYLGLFAPGEAYWVKDGTRRVGVLLHLGAILPCGVLLVLQFVPKIRQRYLLFHRINGYLVLVLLCLGLVGGLMVTRHAFGGEISTQGAMYATAFLVVVSVGLGYYNIKRRQIEEHRKWMLRAAVYLGSIITVRILMIISAFIISSTGQYSTPFYCDEINYALDYNQTKIAEHGSPDCVGQPGSRLVLVPANMTEAPIQVASALRSGFGNAMWLSIFLHFVALEIYIHLTPSETARLRAISYQKQLEAGAKRPGSEGLTSDKLGDVPAYQHE